MPSKVFILPGIAREEHYKNDSKWSPCCRESFACRSYKFAHHL